MERREYSLDVIKIIATILIVFHHYQQVTGAMFSVINFWDGKFYFGYIVELFFVLSGYFMWRYVDRINATYSFKCFILKKMQRLLPLVAIGAVVYEILLIIYQILYGQQWLGIQVTLWGTVIDALGIQDGWGLRILM